MSRVAVIDYGAGNLRSVAGALKHLGADFEVTSDPAKAAEAHAIILPGQGAFGDCMANLRKGGMNEVMKEAAASGKPFLGICIGLQIIFDSSEEFGEHEGLGILPGRNVRFSGADFEGTPPALKIPHMGWTRVHPVREHPLFAGIDDGAYFYFVHSFYPVPERDEDILATADHGGEFVCAAARDNVMAVQFHPEKSQDAGLRLLTNFLEIAKGASSSA
ncbi:MAG: imidazole glycerol phosphate synthase subunit HisH [Deltaproteobacteria bacterium]|nr:imidazole glycerol phosphate synthase subunit HisH [Deltaproteobacteria bacterium]